MFVKFDNLVRAVNVFKYSDDEVEISLESWDSIREKTDHARSPLGYVLTLTHGGKGASLTLKGYVADGLSRLLLSEDEKVRLSNLLKGVAPNSTPIKAIKAKGLFYWRDQKEYILQPFNIEALSLDSIRYVYSIGHLRVLFLLLVLVPLLSVLIAWLFK